MTRHIKANRRYKVTYEVLAVVQKELIIMASDDAVAEEMFQRLEDSGAFRNTFEDIKGSHFEVEIVEIEDVGNAITGE